MSATDSSWLMEESQSRSDFRNKRSPALYLPRCHQVVHSSGKVDRHSGTVPLHSGDPVPVASFINKDRPSTTVCHMVVTVHPHISSVHLRVHLVQDQSTVHRLHSGTVCRDPHHRDSTALAIIRSHSQITDRSTTIRQRTVAPTLLTVRCDRYCGPIVS